MVDDSEGDAESDAGLLNRFSSHGDAKAFLTIYLRHQKQVRAAALRVLAQDQASVDDVVQIVFSRLSSHPPAAETLRDLRSWLVRCATNHALNLLRDRTRRAIREVEFSAAEIDRQEWRKRVNSVVPRLLEKLSPGEASALHARYIEGLEFEEISTRFGWPSPESARKRITRAIHKLRADVPLLALCGALLAGAAVAQERLWELLSGAFRSPASRAMVASGSMALLALLFFLGRQPSIPPHPVSAAPVVSGNLAIRESAGNPEAALAISPFHPSRQVPSDVVSIRHTTPIPAFSSGKLIAHWPMDGFHENLTLDRVSGLRAEAQHPRDAVVVGGYNGSGALRFMGKTGLLVKDAAFLNEVAGDDSFTISLWHRNDGVASASSFYGVSDSHYDRRGIQAHIPWKDGRVYWDTSGKQRLDVDPANIFPHWDWQDGSWHHYAFVKNGDIQSIWIDGREAASGLGGPLPQDFTAFWIGSRESNGPVPTSPGAIDDLAVLGIALRPDQIAELARGSAPEAILIDRDADGDDLPDSYELHHRLNVSAPDAIADPDDDGLNNLAEFQLMTDPNNPDSDRDGLGDGPEANSRNRSTEPLICDTDQDGLSDGAETSTQLRGPAYRSHPLAFDTDGDGFSDGVEAAFACDPSNPSSKPMTSSSPVLAAYWDFDVAEEPWKDSVSGLSAIPSATCQLVRGPKGGAVRFRGGTGMQVPAPQVSQLAAAMNTMVVSFWSKRWKPSRGTSVFLESPSSPGAIGIRIHSPWKDGSVIFDTPRDPGFRGTSRGWVPAHAVGFDATAEAEQWHHFLFSIHEQRKEIWIDGRCVYQGEAGPLPRDLADLWIGGPPGSPGISGMIDEFAIFLSPLDEDDIERLSQGVKPTTIANERLAPAF